MPKISDFWFRSRGWIGVATLGPACLLALFSDSWIPEDSWWDAVVDVLAWALLLGGIALRVWATLYLGSRRGRVVVQDGPFSLCRNPLYVGSFLIALSLAAFLESLTVALAVAIAAWVYASSTVRAEERVLEATFGVGYTEYKGRTRRFVPRLGSFHAPPRIDLSVHALSKEMRRMARLALIPGLHEVVERLRVAHWWPHLVRLP